MYILWTSEHRNSVAECTGTVLQDFFLKISLQNPVQIYIGYTILSASRSDHHYSVYHARETVKRNTTFINHFDM